MSNNDINICLACDNNYAKHAGVVIASILSNANKDDKITIFILNSGIKKKHKEALCSLKTIKDCNIKFIDIKEELFEEYKKVKTHSYVTLATYYRLKLPSLLNDVKKIIYFDCDFVINHSLKELYYTDLEGKPIAGVKDIKRKAVLKNPTYVNAGMLIFDLDKMRELNLEAAFLRWTQEHLINITCGDQEIINEVCKGQIKLLPDEWNVQSSNFTNRSSYTKNPKGIHFISKKKPWHYGSYSYHKSYYFKYLQLTPWALNKKEQILWGKVNQVISCIKYLGYRPLFLLRPKFYQAIYHTYITPILKGD